MKLLHHYVRSFFGLGFGIERCPIWEDRLQTRHNTVFAKVFLGPWVFTAEVEI
jgi:hypothetical protein